METWIKLYRKCMKWEFYKDVAVCKLFLHLLLTVQHEPTTYRGIALDRGERLFGYAELGLECGLKEKQVRRAIGILRKGREIECRRAGKGQVAKVLKYSFYQDSQNPSGQQKGTQIAPKKATYKDIKDTDVHNCISDDCQKVLQIYERNIGEVNPITQGVIAELCARHGADLVLLALTEAVKSNAKSISYIEGIFRNWDADGVRTTGDALRVIAQHRCRPQTAVNVPKSKPKPRKNSFADYDCDEVTDIERELMARRIDRLREEEN